MARAVSAPSRPGVIGSDYMASVPAWLRIIRNPQLQVGPTLPFIVGAIRAPMGAAPRLPCRRAGRTL